MGLGALLGSFTLMNLGLFIIYVLVAVWRTKLEESVLGSSTEYLEFKGRTKYSLIPGVI